MPKQLWTIDDLYPMTHKDGFDSHASQNKNYLEKPLISFVFLMCSVPFVEWLLSTQLIGSNPTPSAIFPLKSLGFFIRFGLFFIMRIVCDIHGIFDGFDVAVIVNHRAADILVSEEDLDHLHR